MEKVSWQHVHHEVSADRLRSAALTERTRWPSGEEQHFVFLWGGDPMALVRINTVRVLCFRPERGYMSQTIH